jgi:predicted DNA-binding transcriptional regulator YafY
MPSRSRTRSPGKRRRLPRAVHAPLSRSAFFRLSRIHGFIQEGKICTAKSIARALEVSPRTVKRDIECLRDSHHAPIEWDPYKRSYRYDKPYDFLSGLHLSAEESLALVLAGNTFAAWRGTPLGRALSSALTQIADFAQDAVTVSAGSMRACLHLDQVEQDLHVREHRHFADLLNSIVNRCVIHLVYHKPTAATAELRQVQPLKLAYLDHGWVLIAHDLARNARRHFVLARIESLEMTHTTFQPPPRAEIDHYLLHAFGRFASSTLHTVVLQFDATAAGYLRETPWHATQTIEPQPEGAVRLSFTVNDLRDVCRRILAQSGQVRAIAPPELIALVHASAQAVAQGHSPAP